MVEAVHSMDRNWVSIPAGRRNQNQITALNGASLVGERVHGSLHAPLQDVTEGSDWQVRHAQRTTVMQNMLSLFHATGEVNRMGEDGNATS